MVRNLLRNPLSLLCMCLFASGQASSPNTQGQNTTTIRTSAHEVLLDLVVRDKHHRPITNLRPEEVEVSEDGVPQKVQAFHTVQGAEQLQEEREGIKNA